MAASAQSEPVGAQKRPDRLKNSKLLQRQRDISVCTAGSFVLQEVPIGTRNPFPRACFSRLPRTCPHAETGRSVSKSILIGAPIPYAERPLAGFRGELQGGPRFFQSTVYSLQTTVYSVQLQSTVYSLQPTVYSLQSAVYRLQSTVYSLHPAACSQCVCLHTVECSRSR